MGNAFLYGHGGGVKLPSLTNAASASDMLSGKQAIGANGQVITGNIPTKSAQTYTPGTSNQTISAGRYLSGAQTILGDSDLVAGNIRSGVNIFGVTGTFEGGKELLTVDISSNPVQVGLQGLTNNFIFTFDVALDTSNDLFGIVGYFYKYQTGNAWISYLHNNPARQMVTQDASGSRTAYYYGSDLFPAHGTSTSLTVSVETGTLQLPAGSYTAGYMYLLYYGG